MFVGNDMGQPCVPPDAGAPEQDAALHFRSPFHRDAREQNGIDHGALNAAALGHQRVQAHTVRPDVGGGLVGPLGPDGPFRRKEVRPDVFIQKLHGAVIVFLHGANLRGKAAPCVAL